MNMKKKYCLLGILLTYWKNTTPEYPSSRQETFLFSLPIYSKHMVSFPPELWQKLANVILELLLCSSVGYAAFLGPTNCLSTNRWIAWKHNVTNILGTCTCWISQYMYKSQRSNITYCSISEPGNCGLCNSIPMLVCWNSFTMKLTQKCTLEVNRSKVNHGNSRTADG